MTAEDLGLTAEDVEAAAAVGLAAYFAQDGGSIEWCVKSAVRAGIAEILRRLHQKAPARQRVRITEE